MRKPGEADASIIAAPEDLKIAQKLACAIARYRTPRSLQTKRSLPAQLRVLLAGSGAEEGAPAELSGARFLIVVCTPRTPADPEARELITGFLRSRGEGRILPVLAEGDPVSSFPPELLNGSINGPDLLAADLREGRSWRAARRRKAETLRLLAALLDCEYDDLRQRERARRTRFGVMAASLLLVPLLAALAVRSTTFHVSTEGNLVVFRRGLPVLQPLLGSEEIVIDTGAHPADLAEEGARAAAARRWCLRGGTGAGNSCFALLDRWLMEPLVESFPRDVPGEHIYAFGAWSERAAAPLLATIESCDRPGYEVGGAVSRLLRLREERQRLRRALLSGSACEQPGHALQSAALLVALGERVPEAIEKLQAGMVDTDSEVALALADVLVSHGAADRRTVDRLLRFLSAPETSESLPAATLLLRLDPGDRRAAAVLWNALARTTGPGSADLGTRLDLAQRTAALPPDPQAVEHLFAPLESPATTPEALQETLAVLRSLTAKDPVVQTRLRRLLGDSRLEVALTAAEKLADIAPRDPAVAERLAAILKRHPAEGARPFEEKPFFRAVAALRKVPGAVPRASAALRRALQDTDPGIALRAAELLSESGDTPDAGAILARLRQMLPRLPGPLLYRAAQIAALLPGDRTDFARALEGYLQEKLRPAPTIGPPPPPDGPPPCDLVRLIARIARPAPEVLRFADEQLAVGDGTCYTQAELLRPGEEPDTSLRRLLSAWTSREAERSSAYRRAVASAIASLAIAPAGQAPAIPPEKVRAALLPWYHSPLPHHRLAAALVLDRLPEPEIYRLPTIPLDRPPQR